VVIILKGGSKYHGEYKCSKFSDICGIIIPFFKQYNLLGVKVKDFQDWCKVADIIKAGKHLTPEGLAEASQSLYINF